MLPTDPALLATIHRVYDDACARLLAAYGHAITFGPDDTETRAPRLRGYVSMVRAAGVGITLLSLVSAERDLLVETYPLGREHASALDVADWCRELNNQLVGRMKNKLLEVGCHIASDLPTLVSCADVGMLGEPGVALRTRHVAVAGARMALTLAARLPADGRFALTPSTSDDGAVMHEGIVLF